MMQLQLHINSVIIYYIELLAVAKTSALLILSLYKA